MSRARPIRKRAQRKPAPQAFGTAQVCPLGIDLWGNFPDGSIYMLSLSWPDVAALAKRRGKRVVGKGGTARLKEQIGDLLPLSPPVQLPEPPPIPWDHNIDTR